MRLKIFFLLPGLFLSQQLFAQSVNNEVSQVWLYWHNRAKISNLLSYSDDISFQHQISEGKWNRAYYNPKLSVNQGGVFEPIAGISLWYTDPDSLTDVLEIRPWLGIKVFWPNVGRLNFQHFSRFEERFNYLADTKMWYNFFRFRYELGIVVPINHDVLINNTIYIRTLNEIYIGLNDLRLNNLVSKNRLSFRLGYRVNTAWKFEAGYSYDLTKVKSEEFNLTSHLIQARIYFSIP